MSDEPKTWVERLGAGFCVCLVLGPIVAAIATMTGSRWLTILGLAFIGVPVIIGAIGMGYEWWAYLFGGSVSRGAYSSARDEVRGFFPWLLNRPRRK